MADDGNVVTRGAAKSTTVTGTLLDVRDDGTLGNLTDGKDVADGEGSVLTAVDELAGVHALVGDEGLGVETVPVRVPEDDPSERSTTTGVVDDVLHDTTDVTVTLSIVERPELGRVLVEAGVGLEDRATTADRNQVE